MSVATPLAALEQASRERVDVWEVALDTGAHEADYATLSETERAFAARLRIGAPAWVAARAALRRVLAAYLGLAPAQVELETGAHGKPRLAPGTTPDLRFNLSHSRAVALVAVRLGHEVGVDIEARRSGVDGAAIARECFTAAERAAMLARPGEAPEEAFFRYWVRHEALSKASGRGIAAPPAERGDGALTVRELDGVPGCAAAIASDGTGWTVRRMALRP